MFSRHLSHPRLTVDGYFGLGIQKSDMDLMPPHYRALIVTSELLRAASIHMPWMYYAADSLYVHACRASSTISSVAVQRQEAAP